MIGRLDIHTTRAILDSSFIPARIDTPLTQPGYTMTRQKGGIDVEAEHPRLIVDSSECQAEEGDKTVSRFIADTAQEARQALQDGCTEHAQNGWYMMKNFHSSKNVLADLAQSKITPGMRQPVLIFIPSQPPEVGFTDNVFHMTGTPDQLNFDWNVRSTADVETVQEGSVNFRMAQYPSIEINYIPPTALDITA